VTLRIWLHEGHDGGPGLAALGLDHLGFSTWAVSKQQVLAKIPGRFEAYCEWRTRHGLPVRTGTGGLDVVDHVVGNEILFPPDLDPASAEEIELTMNLMACSRADLLGVLEGAPEAALDWDPSYERFAPWADWRTIRANLAHIANAETHYYATNIGHRPAVSPADPSGDWRVFLPRSRADVMPFLEELRSSDDLSRIRMFDPGYGEESWSVRKALRRLVGHELTHTKSIVRILADYRRLHPGA